MTLLYLVRHGQAAFGTDDYDRLTERGIAQARLLGAHFAQIGVRFDAVIAGELTRHMQTAQAVLAGADQADLPVRRDHRLNEYDAASVLAAWGGAPDAKASVAREPAQVKAYFKALRDALLAWADGQTQPAGMPSFVRFQQDVIATLDELRRSHRDQTVLVSTSGGPIGAAVCAVLGAPADSAVDLSLHVRNTSITVLQATHRLRLLSFNAVPHLDGASDRSLATYA